jgi:hypothetical protein
MFAEDRMIGALVAFLIAGAGADPLLEAKELYDAGSEAYRQGQYEVAINAFEEAYKLAPRPPVIFSLAQSHRLQYFVDGDHKKVERAIELYREYLRVVEKGGRREDVAQLLSTLVPIAARKPEATEPTREPASEPIIAGRVIVSSRIENATARVDGGDPQKIPATFEVKPGQHRIVVEAPEHQPKTLETVAVASSVVAVNVELDEIPGQINIRAPEGASVHLDGRPIGAGPIADPIEVRSGRHTIAVIDRGHEPFVELVELGRGGRAVVDVELEMTTQRMIAHGLFAGGAAAFLGMGVAGGFALGAESDARALEEKVDGKMSLTEAEARMYGGYESRRDDFVNVAAGAAVIGAGAIVTGVIVYLFDTPDVPRARF